MSDLIERLRYWNPATFPLVAQAADELERLNNQTLALVAEISGLRRERADAARQGMSAFHRRRYRIASRTKRERR